MSEKVIFHSIHLPESWKLANYLAVGGYEALKKILAENTPPDEIINQIMSDKRDRLRREPALFVLGDAQRRHYRRRLAARRVFGDFFVNFCERFG